MSAAAATPDLLPPSRSGRLLALVHRLIDYGKHIAATLRERQVPNDTTDLVCKFGTGDIALILARIAQGLLRAGLLREKIGRVAPRLDAEPQPKLAPSPRTPRSLPCEAQPPSPPRSHAQCSQARDAAPTPSLANLPTAEEIAVKVRHQRIGAVLADICRDLGIYPSHPLWQELHLAIDSYGGNWVRMAIERLDRAFPIAPIVARLEPEPAVPPEPHGTGPPLAIPPSKPRLANPG